MNYDWKRALHGVEGRTISRVRLYDPAETRVDTTFDHVMIEFTDGSMMLIDERSQSGEMRASIVPTDIAEQLRNAGYPAEGAE